MSKQPHCAKHPDNTKFHATGRYLKDGSPVFSCAECKKSGDRSGAARQKKHREGDKEYFDRERARKREWARQARAKKKAESAEDTP